MNRFRLTYSYQDHAFLAESIHDNFAQAVNEHRNHCRNPFARYCRFVEIDEYEKAIKLVADSFLAEKWESKYRGHYERKY